MENHPRTCLHLLDQPTGAGGLQVYCRAYLQGHADHLGRVFSGTKNYLGENNLNFFAREFVQLFCSDHPDLGRYGRAFPEFLQSRTELSQHPEVCWFAKLDWFWHDATVHSVLRIPQGIMELWLFLTDRPGGNPDTMPDSHMMEDYKISEDSDGGLLLIRSDCDI